MDIVDSEKCNADYIEVRKRNRTGELVGFYCGNKPPTTIKNYGDLWILFESKTYDSTSSMKGFLAEFALNKHNELTGETGQVASILYPQCHDDEDTTYTWRIIGVSNTKIVLKFLDVFFTDADCNFLVHMEIYDGYSNSAPLLKKVCDGSVTTVESTTNVIFIEYYAHMTSCNKFLLEWKQVSVPRVSKTGNSSCGFNGIIDISNVTTYNFSSPGFPRGYGKNLNCEWIFNTRPEQHLDISFTDLDLEGSYQTSCWGDKISIYSGYDISDMKLVSRLCTFNASKNLNIPYGNYLKVVFTTNEYTNGTGFAAKVINCTFSLQ